MTGALPGVTARCDGLLERAAVLDELDGVLAATTTGGRVVLLAGDADPVHDDDQRQRWSSGARRSRRSRLRASVAQSALARARAADS
jgi:hypothetical protein